MLRIFLVLRALFLLRKLFPKVILRRFVCVRLNLSTSFAVTKLRRCAKRSFVASENSRIVKKVSGTQVEPRWEEIGIRALAAAASAIVSILINGFKCADCAGLNHAVHPASVTHRTKSDGGDVLEASEP